MVEDTRITLNSCPSVTTKAECEVDVDCDGKYDDECAYTACKEGLCVQEYRSGVSCRDIGDACDLTEYCSGRSPVCPPDIRRDWAYAYNCDGKHYLCGISEEYLASGSNNAYYLGDHPNICPIGTVSEKFVVLPWPECIISSSNCISSANCSENRALLNFAEARCDKATGEWSCYRNVRVVDSTPLPVCPWAPSEF